MSASIICVSTLSVAAVFHLARLISARFVCIGPEDLHASLTRAHIFRLQTKCSLLTKKDHVSYIRPVFVCYEKNVCKFACKCHLLYHFGLTFYVLTDKSDKLRSKSEVIECRSSLDLLVKCWLYNCRYMLWASHGHNYRERQFKWLDVRGIQYI